MGYCYEVRGSRRVLVCDGCGHAGGCRKVPCKYGYCPAVALCAVCRKTHKAEHDAYCDENCKAASEEFAAREARKAEMLDRGEYVRTSASICDDGETVAVTFRDAFDNGLVYLMDKETYRRVPLMEPVTIDSYSLQGRVIFRARLEGRKAS
jgi:hypothetical protein